MIKSSRKRSYYGHNLGTTTETIYTCPPNCTAELTYLHATNNSNNSIDFDADWYVSADNYASNFIVFKGLSNGEFTFFKDLSIMLQAGDEIRITPSAAGHLDSIVTVTETFVPVG